jgi:hypothetical protein
VTAIKVEGTVKLKAYQKPERGFAGIDFSGATPKDKEGVALKRATRVAQAPFARRELQRGVWETIQVVEDDAGLAFKIEIRRE